jgi:MoaA/NifB/PqqE/SkfB family radical SAM enzyme
MRIIRTPVLCNYYLTYRCNAKCYFCDIWEKPSPYVAWDNVAANLRDLRRMGVRVVDFTGGEPLLHRELPRFLQEAKRLGFITTVTTNGLLYPKYANQLRGLVDMLHFSLDSPDASRHNAWRGVACFDHVQQSIQVARSLGERPDLLCTVMDKNIHELETLYREIAQPNGLVLILNPIFGYNDVGDTLSAEHHGFLRRFARQRGVYLNEAFLSLREQGGNHTNRPICRAGDAVVVISPENQLVLPCYHLGLEHHPLQNDLYDRWYSPDVRQARAQAGRLPACEGCTINCYMEPSMTLELDRWWLQSLPSTVRYTLEKWVWGAG